jgi:hypothetical protein
MNMTMRTERQPMNRWERPDRSERGFAVIIVLALLLMMTAFVVGNNAVLYQLHLRLRLIDARQIRQFNPPDPAPVIGVEPSRTEGGFDEEDSELEEVARKPASEEDAP